MNHLRTLFSHFDISYRPTEESFAQIETALLPHLLRILKRDESLWETVEIVPGIKLPWTKEKGESGWGYVNTVLFQSIVHGDPKEKFKVLFAAAKEMIPSMGSKADELEEILDKKENQDSLRDILDMLMTTRLASIITDIAKEVDMEAMGVKMDDMEQFLEIAKNPMEHPLVKAILARVHTIVEEKVRHGKINVTELRSEMEMLRVKFQSSFGKYMNNAVFGGNTTGNTAAEIVSNHPDARRARMLARLQRKQQDKNRTKE